MPRACNFTIERWSVLVSGVAKLLVDAGEKLSVMQAFMNKYAAGYEYTPMALKDMSNVNVIALQICEMSGKSYA